MFSVYSVVVLVRLFGKELMILNLYVTGPVSVDSTLSELHS